MLRVESSMIKASKASQKLLDVFSNFISTVTDDMDLIVKNDDNENPYILILDDKQGYYIEWIGGSKYKSTNQYDSVLCKHIFFVNGVQTTQEKKVHMLNKHVRDLFQFASDVAGTYQVLYK